MPRHEVYAKQEPGGKKKVQDLLPWLERMQPPQEDCVGPSCLEESLQQH